MNKKILFIRFQNFQKFKKEILDAILTKKKCVQSKNEVYFESSESFRKFMTMQKIEILVSVANLKPLSIYALAQIVDRDRRYQQ